MYLLDKLPTLTGIPRDRLKNFLSGLAKLAALRLAINKEVRIPYLGLIILKRNKKGRRLIFKPCQSLLNNISLLTPSSLDDILSILKQSIDYDYDIDLDEQSSLTVSQRRRFTQEVEKNPLKFEFFRYLQQDYPYYQPWTHPITKETYYWEEVSEAIAESKVQNPKGYASLYLLWLGIRKRKDIMLKYNITVDNLWIEVVSYIDLVVTTLVFPELNPLENKDT